MIEVEQSQKKGKKNTGTAQKREGKNCAFNLQEKKKTNAVTELQKETERTLRWAGRRKCTT